MRIVALAGLVVFVCLSIIFSVFVIVRSVLLVLPYSVMQFRILVEILRVLLALALAYCWLLVWKAITDRYFWGSTRSVRRQDAS
jgi:uncharacterized membrane protein YqjE